MTQERPVSVLAYVPETVDIHPDSITTLEAAVGKARSQSPPFPDAEVVLLDTLVTTLRSGGPAVITRDDESPESYTVSMRPGPLRQTRRVEGRLGIIGFGTLVTGLYPDQREGATATVGVDQPARVSRQVNRIRGALQNGQIVVLNAPAPRVGS